MESWGGNVQAYRFRTEITKASCQAWLKLLIANEVRIGGPGGGGSQRPGGNWVTVGFDSPLVHPSPSWAPSIDVHWGRRSKHKKSNGRTRTVSVFVESDVFCTITCLFITKASCQAWLKLLIANEVRIGGPGGGGSQSDHFEAVPQLILVALAVVFEAYVPGGNWVTGGFDSPLVHPSPSWAPSIDVHWGRPSPLPAHA